MSAANEARPGWPEFAVALAAYLVLLVLLVLWVVRTPDEAAALRGIVGGGANGVAGIAGFAAAWALRRRDLRAFGLRAVAGRWLLVGAALGVVAYGASFAIEAVYFRFVDEANTQGDFQAAAKAGTASLVALLVSTALLTPLGEELVFRGVVGTVLNRHGAWVGVVGSAAIFAAVHGPSVIFLLAFMVGVLAGVLLVRTASVWPGVVLHVVYNGLHLLTYSVQ